MRCTSLYTRSTRSLQGKSSNGTYADPGKLKAYRHLDRDRVKNIRISKNVYNFCRIFSCTPCSVELSGRLFKHSCYRPERRPLTTIRNGDGPETTPRRTSRTERASTS